MCCRRLSQLFFKTLNTGSRLLWANVVFNFGIKQLLVEIQKTDEVLRAINLVISKSWLCGRLLTFKLIFNAVNIFSLLEWIKQSVSLYTQSPPCIYRDGGLFIYWKGNLEWLLVTDLILPSLLVLLSAHSDLTRCFQTYEMRVVSLNHLLYLQQYNDSFDRSTSPIVTEVVSTYYVNKFYSIK